MLQIPRIFPVYLASEVQERSNAPVPGQKLTTKVSKSRAIPPYVPGVNSPGWPPISNINIFLPWAVHCSPYTSPTISVTTIYRGLRDVNFTAALPLESTGSYYRDPTYRICCLYGSNLGPDRNRWGQQLLAKKVVCKISFQTVVFSRNLGKRQSRYRHPKTEEFTLLAWTFNVDLLLILLKEKDGWNISLWTSYFGLGSRKESTMGPAS